MSKLKVTLALVMSLAAALLYAQQPGEESPPVKEESSAVESDPAATNEQEPPLTAPDKQESPFDYQASEQISEDLSVSFPVDI